MPNPKQCRDCIYNQALTVGSKNTTKCSFDPETQSQKGTRELDLDGKHCAAQQILKRP